MINVRKNRGFGPMLIMAAGSTATYLVFSVLARDSGGDNIGRATLHFDFAAWMKNFLILQEKAFLPFGLWRGIGLHTAVAEGVPQVPAVLTFSILWDASPAKTSIGVFFTLASVGFSAVFGNFYQMLRNRTSCYCSNPVHDFVDLRPLSCDCSEWAFARTSGFLYQPWFCRAGFSEASIRLQNPHTHLSQTADANILGNSAWGHGNHDLCL